MVEVISLCSEKMGDVAGFLSFVCVEGIAGMMSAPIMQWGHSLLILKV